MQYPLFLTASAVALALLLPAVTGLVHGPLQHEHWLETREKDHKSPKKQKVVPPLVLDTFQNPTHNDLGFWHGTGENLTVQHEPGLVRLFPTDPDQNFHTQFNTHGCFSLWPWQNQFLHVVFEGTDRFSVSLNEHNAECNPRRSPFPGISDSVEASRYTMRTTSGTVNEGGDADDEGEEDVDADTRGTALRSPSESRCQREEEKTQVPGQTQLYIPLSHFHIDQNRVVSVSFHGFYTNEPLTLRRVEIVPMVPPPSPANGHFRMPGKLPTGNLVLRCTRPNSFAFGIDDGQPQYAQEVKRILDEENVRVTFFVVGAGLRDPSTNFTEFYRQMLREGHQVALHSNTHPKMEGLSTSGEIDDEIIKTKEVFKDKLNVESSYFRPPFGTVGARMRQRLAQHLPNPSIVNWSVDVEDWLWANTTTPEKQLDAFYRGVARGGNIAVMHFLNPTTVRYFPQFIRHVKSAGLQIMRIDQCVQSP